MNFKTAEDLQTLFLQTLFASFFMTSHDLTCHQNMLLWSCSQFMCMWQYFNWPKNRGQNINYTRSLAVVLSFNAFRKYPEKCLGIHFIPWWRCHHLLITTLLCPRGSEGGVFCQQILSSSESLLAARLVMNGRKNEFRWNTLFALIHSGNSLARAVIESCC